MDLSSSSSNGTNPPFNDSQRPFVPRQSFSNPQFPPSADPQFPASTFAPPPTAPPPSTSHGRADDPQFDIFDWFPKYQSCQRYFVDHAQKAAPVQAVAAFINIHLPVQRSPTPITSSATRMPPSPGAGGLGANFPQPGNPAYTSISLIPYLRRLVVTGLDFPGVLHGFFGDDWASGVGPLHEQERRNYLFAAKSGGWASVKKDYDMLPEQTVPFMRPLQGAVTEEIEAAEKTWSEWLAMEDWMVGPRSPENMQRAGQRQRGNEPPH
ncbi:MAG: hypothetical protein Q9167_005139 [Letrouitia subvulpina]